MSLARAQPRQPGRRRFLRIAAAATGGLALPALGMPRATPHRRTGVLLGTDAEIQFYHPDAGFARAAIDACFVEVQRLEHVFSLHRADSALSRLNRDGRLADPPAELRELLDTALAIGHATGGAFDVTVQPLWALYAEHFSSPAADPDGPAAAAIAQALARVDFRRVRVTERAIVFGQPGMAITLNGIAQGYITDRVTGLLRNPGLRDVLVNMGEHRALGAHPDGSPWRIGLADPQRFWRSRGSLPLTDCAVATSGGYGTPFDASGRNHHLLDQGNGRNAEH